MSQVPLRARSNTVQNDFLTKCRPFIGGSSVTITVPSVAPAATRPLVYPAAARLLPALPEGDKSANTEEPFRLLPTRTSFIEARRRNRAGSRLVTAPRQDGKQASDPRE